MTGSRRLARAAAWGAAALVCALLAWHAASPPRARNVLVLVMDTARADRCSFLGYARPTTPHLEALARESVVFEDAWSPSPWTLPSHAALFTGREPWDVGLSGRDLVPLPTDVPSLADLLRASGRATLCVTANAWISPSTGLTRGFDRYVPTSRSAFPGTARENHDVAFRWMAEQHAADRPFLAFVNDVEPHTPYAPPDDVARRFLSADLPAAVVQSARTVHLRRSLAISLGLEPLSEDLRRAVSDLYDAELATLDAEIGRLVDRMRTGGFLDDTLVVIVGDHGEGLGDHGWIEHGVRVDRELLRVPLLVRFPRAREAGRRVREVVRLADVLGTILEETGVEARDGAVRTTLLRGLGGRVALGRERPFDEVVENARQVTSEGAVAPMLRVRRSAYDGRFHLLDEEGAPPRLYDVAEDPGETRDLAGERPADRERLRALLPR